MDDRILVIEGFDEVDAYTQSLRNAGLVVERVRADAALSIAREHRIRAVVAPVLAQSGRDLVASIRKARAELPIIAVGGSDEVAHATLCISQPVFGGVFASIVTYVLQQMRLRRAWRELPCEVAVSATDAKNEFASILETAVVRGPVRIEKHGAARAVLIGWDDYEKLTAAPAPLAVLRDEYDARLARMQQPGMYERMQTAFDASPDELAAAAVSQARRGG